MNFNIGTKIKALRLASDLTQEELANRARLTKGFISQLENGKFQTSISLESLADIVDALGISLSEFFSDVVDNKAVFKKNDRVEVFDTGASKFELLVPGSTNNMMDPIIVELIPGESLEKQDPKPGEQFGFVLKGNLTLVIGKKRHTITKNNCFYFKADQSHQFLNTGKVNTEFLWVTTPPQM